MTEGDRHEGEPSPEQQLVASEIRKARERHQDISDVAARMIANWYHGGQTSALYSFQSCGAIDVDRLIIETMDLINDPSHHITVGTGSDEHPEVDPVVRGHIDYLASYIAHAPGTDERGNRGPQDGWHERTSWNHLLEQPPATEDQQVRAAYVEYFGDDEQAEAEFAQRYLGTFDSLTDYAEYIARELDYLRPLDELPVADEIKGYYQFNYAAFGHDMWVGGEIAVLHLDNRRAAIFNNRSF